jgi:hypothetical protein
MLPGRFSVARTITLSPEERRLRARVAGLTASSEAGPSHPRTVAAREEFDRATEEGKRQAGEWLQTQIDAGRLRPLDDDVLAKVAAMIRVAEKADSA